MAQCRYEASVATSGSGSGDTRAGAYSAAGQGVAEGISQFLDQRGLVHQCMLARGYHQTK
jgi:hypothetical protein